MAEKVTVELVDDIDGSPAEEKVLFALGGSSYEIDLSKANADKLRALLKPYIDAGRPPSRQASVPPVTRRRASSGAAAAGVDPKAIRVWADANNVDVPKRGRIPKPVVDQYLATTNG